MSPRERIRVLSSRIGDSAIASWCAEVLSGAVAYADPHRPSIAWLGGRHAASELRRGDVEARSQDYWPRARAARGLLYIYRSVAGEAVLSGLSDPAWRVRELCAKVARRHGIDRAEPILSRLLDDPVARVRSAAEAALYGVGTIPGITYASIIATTPTAAVSIRL